MFNYTAPSRGGFPKAMGAAYPDPFSARSDKVKMWEQCQELGLLGPAVRFLSSASVLWGHSTNPLF